MLNAVLDFLYAIFDIKLFTGLVVGGLAVMAYWLVRLMTESMLLATLYTPFLVLGALTSNYLMHKYAWIPMPDKDSGVVFACGVGNIVALMVLLVVTRVINGLSEARSREDSEGTNTLLANRRA